MGMVGKARVSERALVVFGDQVIGEKLDLEGLRVG